MIIFFDIETVSIFSKDNRSGTIGGKEADFTKPTSKEYNENIEVYREYRKLKEQYEDGLNFMPEYNKILTITVWVKTNEGVKIKNLEGSEEEQIKQFFEMADKQYNKVAPSFCGHNIKNFDLPFIIKRAMHHGIAIPNRLKAYGKKPWDLEHFIDLFDAYKYLSFSGKGSLDLICNFLNIPTPKQGIDGSQVQEYHDEGKDAEILEYCKRDVEATIAVYDKFVELNLI